MLGPSRRAPLLSEVARVGTRVLAVAGAVTGALARAARMATRVATAATGAPVTFLWGVVTGVELRGGIAIGRGGPPASGPACITQHDTYSLIHPLGV